MDEERRDIYFRIALYGKDVLILIRHFAKRNTVTVFADGAATATVGERLADVPGEGRGSVFRLRFKLLNGHSGLILYKKDIEDYSLFFDGKLVRSLMDAELNASMGFPSSDPLLAWQVAQVQRDASYVLVFGAGSRRLIVNNKEIDTSEEFVSDGIHITWTLPQLMKQSSPPACAQADTTPVPTEEDGTEQRSCELEDVVPFGYYDDDSNFIRYSAEERQAIRDEKKKQTKVSVEEKLDEPHDEVQSPLSPTSKRGKFLSALGAANAQEEEIEFFLLCKVEKEDAVFAGVEIGALNFSDELSIRSLPFVIVTVLVRPRSETHGICSILIGQLMQMMPSRSTMSVNLRCQVLILNLQQREHPLVRCRSPLKRLGVIEILNPRR